MTQYCSLEEAFSNYQPMSRKNKKVKHDSEGFETENNLAQRKTYSSQKSDYDYMCKTAGICVYPEKFSNGSTSDTNASHLKKCEPIQPPVHEYQFTEEDKRRFRQALKIALEEMEPNSMSQQPTPTLQKPISSPEYAPRSFENTQINMSNVDGYIDEELESYMMVNDMKPAIMNHPINPARNVPLPGVESKLTSSLSQQNANGIAVPLQSAPTTSGYVTSTAPAPSPSPAPAHAPAPAPAHAPHLRNQPYTRKNKMLFELLLFSIGGILIILLLEELYKIAHESGVKKALLLVVNMLDKESSLERVL